MNVDFTWHISIPQGDDTIEYGSKTTAQTITVTNGEVFSTRQVVADNYTVENLWATGDGGLDTFEFLICLSDADVFLELRNTMATDEFALIPVQANVPLVLGSDDIAGYQTTTRLDGSELVEATDWDQCDQIQVCNNVADAAGDATVTLILLA